MIQKTQYPELDAMLREHAQKIKGALRDNFVGFYLQGSLAIGDFDLTSDVDFIVVINQDLSPDEVEKVQTVHDQTCSQAARWVRHLEYSYFPKALLSQFSSPYEGGKVNDSEERKLWYFDNGSPEIERSDHCNTLVTRWTVREKGITILGPEPKTFIDPVSADALRREIKEIMLGWGGELLESNATDYKNRFYQSYLVLNFSRMLHDLYEGRVSSKRESAEWAKQTLDPKWRPLIEFCWTERQDTGISIRQPANEDMFPEVLNYLRYIVEEGRKYTI